MIQANRRGLILNIIPLFLLHIRCFSGFDAVDSDKYLLSKARSYLRGAASLLDQIASNRSQCGGNKVKWSQQIMHKGCME